MMYRFPARSLLAFGLMSALAACGGGGGAATDTPAVTPPTVPTTPTTPTTPVTPTTPGAETGTQMRSAATSLIDTFAPTSTPTYTTLSTIQTGGSATYDGYLYGDLANTSDTVTDSLIGTLSLTAGFTGTSAVITGSVTDFADDNDASLTGSLTLSGGGLNRAGNPASDATLTVGASGTLTDAAGQDLVIGVQLEGDFLGGTAAAVGGEVLGGVTVNGVDQNFDGGFIAEK